MHVNNPGFNLTSAGNIFLFSIIASFIYDYSGISGASIFHCLWNYVQIAIYSIPVSGLIKGDIGILRLINSNLNLGFGLEGSLITIIIQVVVILYIIVKERRVYNGKRLFKMWK